jgi:hypothetical protein
VVVRWRLCFYVFKNWFKSARCLSEVSPTRHFALLNRVWFCVLYCPVLVKYLSLNHKYVLYPLLAPKCRVGAEMKGESQRMRDERVCCTRRHMRGLVVGKRVGDTTRSVQELLLCIIFDQKNEIRRSSQGPTAPWSKVAFLLRLSRSRESQQLIGPCKYSLLIIGYVSSWIRCREG